MCNEVPFYKAKDREVTRNVRENREDLFQENVPDEKIAEHGRSLIVRLINSV